MSKIFLASTLATLLCASLAAQAPQTPSPNPSASPATQQPRTGADTQQPPTGSAQSAARSAAKADSITVEGCIQRSASASATAGAAGTAGSASSDSGFILASAMKPAGTSGSSASSSAPIASSYRLDADASKLTPHVGHKVEISGTVQPAASSSSSASGSASSASASAAPTLKVDNVKMIAATCTP
jgi:hypothetical protein